MASRGSHNDYVGCGKHMIGERMARCQFGTSLVRALIHTYKYIHIFSHIFKYVLFEIDSSWSNDLLPCCRFTQIRGPATAPPWTAKPPGRKIHVGSFGRANFAKGPRSLMVSWDSLMENIKPRAFLFPTKTFFASTKNGPRRMLGGSDCLANEHTSHVILHPPDYRVATIPTGVHSSSPS